MKQEKFDEIEQLSSKRKYIKLNSEESSIVEVNPRIGSYVKNENFKDSDVSLINQKYSLSPNCFVPPLFYQNNNDYFLLEDEMHALDQKIYQGRAKEFYQKEKEALKIKVQEQLPILTRILNDRKFQNDRQKILIPNKLENNFQLEFSNQINLKQVFTLLDLSYSGQKLNQFLKACLEDFSKIFLSESYEIIINEISSLSNDEILRPIKFLKKLPSIQKKEVINQKFLREKNLNEENCLYGRKHLLLVLQKIANIYNCFEIISICCAEKSVKINEERYFLSELLIELLERRVKNEFQLFYFEDLVKNLFERNDALQILSIEDFIEQFQEAFKTFCLDSLSMKYLLKFYETKNINQKKLPYLVKEKVEEIQQQKILQIISDTRQKVGSKVVIYKVQIQGSCIQVSNENEVPIIID